ncbi:hypothetical protein M9458_019082, partial [Cirrhinus mrigala]
MRREAVCDSPGSCPPRPVSVCLPVALSAVGLTVSQNRKYSKDTTNMQLYYYDADPRLNLQ